MEFLNLARDLAVRRVQDIAGESGTLPRKVHLPAIDDRRHIGGGGEATIWRAKLKGKLIVSRECNPPDGGDWNSEDGKAILKVSRRGLHIYECYSSPSLVRTPRGYHSFTDSSREYCAFPRYRDHY